MLSRLSVLTLTSLGCHAAQGQTLHYTGEWRLIYAGRVHLHIGADSGRLALETAGLAERLYPVRSTYTVNYHQQLCAASSVEDYRQGRKYREIRVTYGKEKATRVELDQAKSGTQVGSNEVPVPACVHDVLGALEQLRRQPRAEPGTLWRVPVSDGKRTANVEVRALDREKIRTAAGEYQTTRYEAMLFNGVIFRRSARLFIWLTDDARRLPVQIRVQMPFYLGTVTLQLGKEEQG
ncbi:MAG: DUF3108 domain-containing protein [Acidobacteria bacterium]|nr:DUF3108 domain-containing protein [Acidobacteriota bacterium]